MGQTMIETKPKTDCQRVLELLREHRGGWVDRPYRRLSVMWHSRVAELRRKGYVIECRRGEADGRADWQYRLAGEPTA